MLIRPATSQDLPAICRLADQINYEHACQHPDIFRYPAPEDEDRTCWRAAMEDQTALMLVAESAQELQGFITAKVTQNTLIPFLWQTKVCRIGTIVVDNQQQGKGIGKALMLAAQAWGLKRGAQEIRLEVFHFNQAALKFYTQLGFHTQSHIMRKRC